MSMASPSSSDPMSSYYSSLSLAKSRISLLSSLLPSLSLSSISDSPTPAISLLKSQSAYSKIYISLLSSSTSISPICNWLYDTYISSDPHLRLVVVSFVPIISHLYLSLIHSSPETSLAGFEAVLLSLYAEEVKTRAGKPVLVTVPDLSQPSLYHTPKSNLKRNLQSRPVVGVVSQPLEPQTAVKSTKRACIVGVALDCYFKRISEMPFWSKLDLCKFVAEWAGQDCCCKDEFDHTEGEIVIREMGKLGIEENGEMGSLEIGEDGENRGIGEMGSLEIGENGENRGIGEMGSLEIGENGENRGNGGFEKVGSFEIGENGENGKIVEIGSLENGEKGGIVENGIDLGSKKVRIPLPWEILQPVLRILGHCLLAPLNVAEVKEAAGVAVRCLYARGSHELEPRAILATRSLIQLDKRAHEAERAALVASASSKVNTPSKAKKPEMLLVSK